MLRRARQAGKAGEAEYMCRAAAGAAAVLRKNRPIPPFTGQSAALSQGAI
jgi:hypothetical protein